MTRKITVRHTIEYITYFEEPEGDWFKLTLELAEPEGVDDKLLLLSCRGLTTSTKRVWPPPVPAPENNPPLKSFTPWYLARALDVGELSNYKTTDPADSIERRVYYKRSKTSVSYHETWEEAYQAMVAASSVIQTHVQTLVVDLQLLAEKDTLAISGKMATYAVGGVPPYKWSWEQNSSDGFINEKIGWYQAGLSEGVDILKVTDSTGAEATFEVTVCKPDILEYEKDYEDNLIVDPRPGIVGDPCAISVTTCLLSSVVAFTGDSADTQHSHRCEYDGVGIISVSESGLSVDGHIHNVNDQGDGIFLLESAGEGGLDHTHQVDINNPLMNCRVCIGSALSGVSGMTGSHWHKVYVNGDILMLSDLGVEENVGENTLTTLDPDVFIHVVDSGEDPGDHAHTVVYDSSAQLYKLTQVEVPELHEHYLFINDTEGRVLCDEVFPYCALSQLNEPIEGYVPRHTHNVYHDGAYIRFVQTEPLIVEDEYGYVTDYSHSHTYEYDGTPTQEWHLTSTVLGNPAVVAHEHFVNLWTCEYRCRECILSSEATTEWEFPTRHQHEIMINSRAMAVPLNVITMWAADSLEIVEAEVTGTISTSGPTTPDHVHPIGKWVYEFGGDVESGGGDMAAVVYDTLALLSDPDNGVNHIHIFLPWTGMYVECSSWPHGCVPVGGEAEPG